MLDEPTSGVDPIARGRAVEIGAWINDAMLAAPSPP